MTACILHLDLALGWHLLPLLKNIIPCDHSDGTLAPVSAWTGEAGVPISSLPYLGEWK